MKKVYVAGPYSAPNVIQVLENIRKGQRAATEMLLKGHSVFCPWADHQLFLQLRGDEKISLDHIRNHSMAWLEVSDLVYVLKGWQSSQGTLAEIYRAQELGIPVEYEQETL
jgi:hypothetical protein